jgi:hypothetical protein
MCFNIRQRFPDVYEKARKKANKYLENTDGDTSEADLSTSKRKRPNEELAGCLPPPSCNLFSSSNIGESIKFN